MTRSALTTVLAAMAALFLLGGPAAPAEEQPQNGLRHAEQEPPLAATPLLSIPQSEYDAGTLRRGEEVTVVYAIGNNGDADLRLVRADGNCSCIRTTILRPVIPPGEEGGVEVVFLSQAGVGQTTRIIELTTNDPQHLMARLTFSAVVVVPFDFEVQTLDLGLMHHAAAEPLTGQAAILIRNAAEAELGDLRTSSPLITARLAGSGEGRDGHHQLNIEISVLPGLPPGPLQESITATAACGRYPPATLPLTGLITDDVEVTPGQLRMMVVETTRRVAADDWQRVYINGHSPDRPLDVYRCWDSLDLLKFDLLELIPGEQFELTVTLEADALEQNSEVTGTISIATNSPSQAVVTVGYTAVRHYFRQLDQGEEDPPTGNSGSTGGAPGSGDPPGTLGAGGG